MLSILFFISLFPFVKADDNWDDFTNNLATDLVCPYALDVVRSGCADISIKGSSNHLVR
jgi:hypothetical protein